MMAVLLVGGVSVCDVTVIMATAFEALDIAVRCLMEAEETNASFQVAVLLGTLHSLLYISLLGM
jgi:uncharacterized membrane protein YadS